MHRPYLYMQLNFYKHFERPKFAFLHIINTRILYPKELLNIFNTLIRVAKYIESKNLYITSPMPLIKLNLNL